MSDVHKILTIALMPKKLSIFGIFVVLTYLSGTFSAWSVTSRASDYVSENTYNNLYPYMNNTMRTNLNPGVTPGQSNAQINVLTRTSAPGTTTRRVVQRGTTSARAGTTATATSARSATPSASTRTVATRTPQTTSARAGTTTSARMGTSSNRNTSGTRRVVARSATGTTGGTARSATTRSTRADGNVSLARQSTSSATVYTTDSEPISSARCMADYVDCMNDYCERQDTEYNRCYCSSKLAQIDSQYQPKIDSLIKQILTLRGTNNWTQAEMDEYWMEMVGQYTGENSWQNLEDALDIDWASLESRVRGQQAFATGHEYCVQHLRGCAYMQTNMRDAYRSQIARDCAAYESSLQRLQNIAESVVEAYK